MSISDTTVVIDYPESDGEPMGETDLHIDWMIRIREILKQHYQGQRVYVGSDLLLYYIEGRPTRFVVPDDFVVLDCDPGRRRVFKIWEEERVPSLVIEVTSKGTSTQDQVTKAKIYEQIGVQEYFLYDPDGSYLKPALQGLRLTDGVFAAIPTSIGKFQCRSLGIDLFLEGDDLVMTDSKTNQRLLSEAEAERDVARTELAARQSAEERIRELEAEIERLIRERDS